EMTILFAGISAVLGMLALNGLPMPYHPVFNVPRFAFASKDRFFLIIFSSDPKYEPAETRRFLEALNPRSIAEVPSKGSGQKAVLGGAALQRCYRCFLARRSREAAPECSPRREPWAGGGQKASPAGAPDSS